MTESNTGDRIEVFEADSQESRQVAEEVRQLFDITDDGSRVLFARGGHGLTGDRPDELLLVHVDSGAVESVLPPDLRERVDAPGDMIRVRHATLSASGRRLAFGSAGEINGIFWYDRDTDDLRRLAPGERFRQVSRGVGISADGRKVTFATDHRPSPGFPPNTFQVYLWRPDAPLQAVSVGTDGHAANGHSMAPALSDDARVLTYATSATNVVTPGSLPDETRFPAWHVVRALLEP